MQTGSKITKKKSNALLCNIHGNTYFLRNIMSLHEPDLRQIVETKKIKITPRNWYYQLFEWNTKCIGLFNNFCEENC